MCDTIIASKNVTLDSAAIFGKNSDRPPNEGRRIAYFPAAHAPRAKNNRVQCAYIEIPQVEKAHAIR